MQHQELKLEQFSEELNSLLDSFVDDGDIPEDIADRMHARIVRMFQSLPEEAPIIMLNRASGSRG